MSPPCCKPPKRLVGLLIAGSKPAAAREGLRKRFASAADSVTLRANI